MTLLIKRGIEANIPSIQSGEMVYALDKRRLYIGSGSSGGGYEIEFNRLTASAQLISNPNGLTRSTLQGLGSVVSGNANITYQVAGGTAGAVTNTLNGHYASLQLQTYGGSTWSTTGRILIQAYGDHNEGSRPTNITFSTVPSGSSTLVDRLKVNGVGVFVSGNLGLTGSLIFSDGTSLGSATMTTALTASYIDYSNVANKPSLVSSSAQVLNGSGVYSSSAQLPSGLVSGSSQVLVGSNVWSSSAQMPSGVVSSSAQTLVNLQTSGIHSSSAQLPSGLVSSSAQFTTASNALFGQLTASFVSASVVSASNLYVDSLSVNAASMSIDYLSVTYPITGTASYALSASYVDYSNVANKPTLVSSSAQVLNGSGIYSSSAQLPSGLVSSSAQILVGSNIWSSSAQMPSGVVSASAQITSLISGQQISPTGVTASLFGTASWSNNSTTSQTASYISLATHNNAIVGTGIVSQSAQIISLIAGQQISASGVTSSGYIVGNRYGELKWATSGGRDSRISGDSGAAGELFLCNTDTIALAAGTSSNYLDVVSRITRTGIQIEKGKVLKLYNPTNISSSLLYTDASNTLQVSASSVNIVGSLTSSNATIGVLTASAITVTNLYVQTLTSSVEYASGSNKIGNSLTNKQELTGSVEVTGSLTVNGSVGLGTVPSNYRLDLSGSQRIVDGYLHFANPAGGIPYIDKDPSSRIEFGSIGGTGGWWTGLHITPSDAINITGQGNTFPRVSHYWTYSTASNPTDIAYGMTVGNYHGYNIGMILGTQDSGSIYLQTQGANRLCVNSNGNVAIGNTTAYDFLDVFGSTTIRGNLAIQGNYGISVNANDGGYKSIAITNGSSSINLATSGWEAQLRNVANGGLSFWTNNTQRATITSGGYVGIGTTSPDVQLHSIGGTTKLNKYANKTTTNYANGDLVLGDDVTERNGPSSGYNLILHSSGTSSIGFLHQTQRMDQIDYVNGVFTIGRNLSWGNANTVIAGNLTVNGTTTVGQLTSSFANLGVVTASDFFAAGAYGFGSSPTDTHTFIGTTIFSGSVTISGSLNATASQAITASYLLGSIATASYALTASYAANAGGGFSTQTTAQLLNISGSTAATQGHAYCSDCYTMFGTGSVVFWDQSSSKWRTPQGYSIQSSRDQFFAELMRTGIDLPVYSGKWIFANLFRDHYVHSTGMDNSGGTFNSNGGLQNVNGNKNISTAARRAVGDNVGIFIFNNAGAYVKANSIKCTKTGGYGILQSMIPNGYTYSGTNPHAFFIGWSNLSNTGGALDTSMVGFLFDPSNISGMGATQGGSTTKMSLLVRSGSVLVSNLTTNYNIPVPTTASYNYYNAELSDAHTCSLWYGQTEDVASKTTIISTNINTNGMVPVMTLWKGATTTAEVYYYPAYEKAMMEF